jgi:hypothetical protein
MLSLNLTRYLSDFFNTHVLLSCIIPTKKQKALRPPRCDELRDLASHGTPNQDVLFDSQRFDQ